MRERINADPTTKLRWKLFMLANSVRDQPACAKVMIFESTPLHLTDLGHPNTDEALKQKLEFAKTALRLVRCQRAGTHDEIWLHWFVQMEENAILNQVQRELVGLGITAETLQLEILAEDAAAD